MSPTDNSSPASAAVSERLFARAVVLLALVLSSAVSATEPPATLEYQSAFAGYRHFDAQAPAIEWRQANDTIRDGADADAAASRSGHPPSPPTDDDHKDHRP